MFGNFMIFGQRVVEEMAGKIAESTGRLRV
jgi:hypothetical protein